MFRLGSSGAGRVAVRAVSTHSQPKAFVFDLGGVVVNSPVHAIHSVEAEHGLPRDALNKAMGRAEDFARLERGELTMAAFGPAFEKTLSEQYGLNVNVRKLFNRMISTMEPHAGMLALIDTLNANGLKTAALTNNWDETRVNPELASKFNVVVESCVVGYRKPEPEIYKLVLDRLGTTPNESIFMDDLGKNLKAAKALGMHTLKVENQDAAVAHLSEMVGRYPTVGAPGGSMLGMQKRGFHSTRVARRDNAPHAGYSLNNMSPKAKDAYDRLLVFMDEHVYPNEKAINAHGLQMGPERWTVNPIIEHLKIKAKEANLWNLFLPLESDVDGKYGHGLTNFEYAHIAEVLGRVVLSSEIFNCSAPDTGNMEVLVCYGNEEQKKEYLEPLLNGDIRSCFSMTEPKVASSDATNIESSIARDGDEYVVNGLKHWISGACDPRCKFTIFLGKTDTSAAKHQQQSMILLPMDHPGITIKRPLPVLGFEDAPHGHAEIEFKNVRVPVANMLLGEGRGFEIAQGRLGPGRVHHCMRMIGIAQRALELMTDRVQKRVAFGKPLAQQGTILQDIARSRCEIEMARLLTLRCAHTMDAHGKRAALDDIAMIKIVAPQMTLNVLDRVIQSHGGIGLTNDFPFAEGFVYARSLRFADGPDEVHMAQLGRRTIKLYSDKF